MLSRLWYILLFLCLTALSSKGNEYLRFTENKGQWHENVKFKVDLGRGAIFVENNRLTYNLIRQELLHDIHENGLEVDYDTLVMPHHAFRMTLNGANPNPEIVKKYPFHSPSNYFIGQDPSKWAKNVMSYAEVTLQEVYPGVSMVVGSNSGSVKYDLVVQPGFSPSVISLDYEGLDGIKLVDGQLILQNTIEDVIELAPFAYQVINGEKEKIACHYTLQGNTVGYLFPDDYNHQLPLVIDPVVIFSSFTGSTANNFGYTATFDNDGFLYSGSTVFGVGYPTTVGAYSEAFKDGTVDIGISKFDTTGTLLIYSTYIGGTDNELPHSLVVNDKNELFIMGTTGSPDFPVDTAAFDTVFHGGTSQGLGGLGIGYDNGCDFFLARLSPDGDSLMNATFYGGALNDGVSIGSNLRYNYADEIRGEVMLDKNGDVLLVSCTRSDDLPMVGNSIQEHFRGGLLDGCIAKFDPQLDSLIWSTYYGGENDDAIYSIAIASDNSYYLAGGTISDSMPIVGAVIDSTYNGGRCDGFVMHIPNAGGSIMQSTYFGSVRYDQVYFVELDRNDNVSVFGQTSDTTNTHVYNATYFVPKAGQFVAKIKPNLDTLIWSTTFGTGKGYPDISPTAFLVDLCNKVYLSGWGSPIGGSLSTNGLPVTWDAADNTTDGRDFYLVVLEDDASALVYASFYGGESSAEHVDGGTSRFDKKGKIYQTVCAGCGGFSDFPIFPTDAVSSSNNSPGQCNAGVFKIDFKLPLIVADFKTEPSDGCAPYDVEFVDRSLTQGDTHYFWDFGDGSEVDTLRNPVHVYPDTGWYEVKLIIIDTMSCNLIDSAFLDIHVWKRPDVLADFIYTDTLSCDTSYVTFTDQSAGEDLVYWWDFGNGYTDTLINSISFYKDTGYYDVSLIVTDTVCNLPDTHQLTVYHNFDFPIEAKFVTDTAPFCDSMLVVTMNESVGNNLESTWWFEGDPVVSEHASYTYGEEGEYYINLTILDTLCLFRDTLIDTVSYVFDFPLDAGFSIDDTIVCHTLTAVVSDTSYGENLAVNWLLNNVVPYEGTPQTITFTSLGTYPITMMIHDTICGFRDTVEVNVTNDGNNYDVESIFTLNELDPCTHDMVLESQSVGNNLTLRWLVDGAFKGTDDSLYLEFPIPGMHYVTLIVTDSVCGLQDTSYQSQYAEGVILDVELGEDRLLCEGDSVELFPYVSQQTNYLWSTGETYYKIYQSAVGYTSVTITEGDCNDVDSVLISAVDRPPFTGYNDTICFAELIPLIPHLDSGFVAWSDDQSPRLVKYTDQAGAFYYTFSDTLGCVYEDSIQVTHKPYSLDIWFPNAFTPDDDGLNDVFLPSGFGVENYELIIFNRWGEQLFQTTTFNQGWDGTFNGQLVPVGVYVYKLTYRDKCHDYLVKTVHGMVTVVR